MEIKACKACKGYFFVLISFLVFHNLCFAQGNTVSQIERAQEITEKEQALRTKLEKEEKVLIKEIVVDGAAFLNENEIKVITSPFQGHWLSKNDIQEIINLLKVAYKQKGYHHRPVKIRHRIRENILKIHVIDGK